MQTAVLPVFLMAVFLAGLVVVLLALGRILSPRRRGAVKQMPYESGMDPIHDTRRRFDVRFHLLAIAFLVFDVELLFLYPWAVAFSNGSVSGPLTESVIGRPPCLFAGGMVFILLLVLGYVYDWWKGVFRWR